MTPTPGDRLVAAVNAAVTAWADTVAAESDPGLSRLPLQWCITRNGVRGRPPDLAGEQDVTERLTRWATALGLEPEPVENGVRAYVGRADMWEVRIYGVVDRAAAEAVAAARRRHHESRYPPATVSQ